MSSQEAFGYTRRDTFNIIALGFTGAFLVVPLLWVAWVVAGRDERVFAINIAIMIGGLAVGWVFGILISPLRGEQDQFQQYARAVAVFFSGYLLAKVDPIITELLKPTEVLAPLAAFRLLSFVVCFIVFMLLAFGWRRYFYGKEAQ